MKKIEKKETLKMKGIKLLWAIVIGLIIGAILTSGFTMAVFNDISTAESASTYSSNSTLLLVQRGWIPATVDLNNTDNRAIYEVAPSADLNYTYTGAYSLKMSVDLQPGKDSIVIGLKIGANDKPEAKGYKGPIYLDTVCFNITPWTVPESDYSF